MTRNFCRLEDGEQNVDNLSYEATKNPIRKLVENFANEGGGSPFTIVEAFLSDNGEVMIAQAKPYTDAMHRDNVFILICWLILATMAAWIWYAKRSK